MEAIIMTETGGPEVLKLRTAPIPVPGKGQVCIAVRSIGVNPVETYWRAGSNGRNPKLPYTPGNDASGVVHAIGPDVKSFAVGDRVFTTGAVNGTYATHCLVDQTTLHHLPQEVGFDAGAALGTAAMAAYRSLFIRGEARPGDAVLVHGATGGVGVVCVQLARANGMRVVGTADDEKGVEMLKQLGCFDAFIHHKEGYFEGVRSSGPYDVVIECLANINLGKDLEVVAKNGRVVIVGSRGKVQIDPRDAMIREADVRGMFLTLQTPKQRDEAVSCLLQHLVQGTLKPVISEVFDLADAPAAHRRVVAPHVHGKVILRPKL